MLGTSGLQTLIWSPGNEQARLENIGLFLYEKMPHGYGHHGLIFMMIYTSVLGVPKAYLSDSNPLITSSFQCTYGSSVDTQFIFKKWLSTLRVRTSKFRKCSYACFGRKYAKKTTWQSSACELLTISALLSSNYSGQVRLITQIRVG